MKPEEQRIAIAEACGWKLNSSDPSPSWSKTWIHPLTKRIGYEVKDMPDYLNDLNAMHEAEKILTPQQKSDVLCWLYDNTINNFEVFHATASQRAEAFLRTMGKWID